LRTSIIGILLGTTVILPSLAHAQAAPATPPQADPPQVETNSGIPDIVVTAQKRSENVQDVPIAISAFTADTLKERAVTSIAQLSAIAPNVNLDAGTPFSGSTAVLSAYIRGIGSDDFAFNIDPGVGIYLDGVYLTKPDAAFFALDDMERIEVLRGPQGTLYGRNATAGAINIVTRAPDLNEFRASVSATYGSYNTYSLRGSLSAPLGAGFDRERARNLLGPSPGRAFSPKVSLRGQRA
jgi:outer membrane receptor protein involved in Fe transport